jgi:hypothetical protein
MVFRISDNTVYHFLLPPGHCHKRRVAYAVDALVSDEDFVLLVFG